MKWDKESVTSELRKQLPYLNEKYGVSKLALFGSFARNTATDESDIDLVAEFNRPIGLKFITLCDELEEIFGRKVDVLTPTSIESIRVRKVANQIKRELTYV